ncbi:hypothetical protein [Natrinema saccharevitans]|uniref:hypothetical protein n=1 Tax=Natrinema saccharevitans TaxID=301967 RepID=UPI0011158A88|nr:hypothetical protein [Natrinema saccharevitans]
MSIRERSERFPAEADEVRGGGLFSSKFLRRVVPSGARFGANGVSENRDDANGEAVSIARDPRRKKFGTVVSSASDEYRLHNE